MRCSRSNPFARVLRRPSLNDGIARKLGRSIKGRQNTGCPTWAIVAGQGLSKSMTMKSDTTQPPLCAAFDPKPRKPRITIPSLACDTHAHVCGPETRYPYYSRRTYTPPDSLLPAYQHMLGMLGFERAVLVQPSVYGTLGLSAAGRSGAWPDRQAFEGLVRGRARRAGVGGARRGR